MQKIKVLWVINELFPEVAEELNLQKTYVGGWVNGLANILRNDKNIKLYIATAFPIKHSKEINANNIKFHVLPTKGNNKNYDKRLENEWKKIIPTINPDVIHIHGTEYAHGLALMNSFPNKKYVISIQGLVSVYVRYYLAGLTFSTILKNISIRDIIRFDTIWQGKINYKKRGVFEKAYISNSLNVMGRTDWDYAHAKNINPEINYHFCNETLRGSFYETNKWKIDGFERYTLFLSQASYPIKGLHKVLEALVIIKKHYPNVAINISGEKIIEKNIIRATGYSNIIKRLITKHKLQSNVNFIGILDEIEMRDQYLKSHIFICPSSIENSPNSLGEAQILGVPSIASYVGGNHNFIEHGVNGFLYRFESIEILAQLIIKIFNDDNLALVLSKNAIKTAEKRHSQKENADRNIEIYRSICNS